MSQFRSISHCNVIYKMITKTIANRLRKVLDACIDEAQWAFVPGRQISENIIIAYKLLHALKKRQSDLRESFVLKLDMSKAYDRVE